MKGPGETLVTWREEHVCTSWPNSGHRGEICNETTIRKRWARRARMMIRGPRWELVAGGAV